MKPILRILLIIVIYSTQIHAQSHPDHNALKSLYRATDGDNWNFNDGWAEGINDENANPCEENWMGITCFNNRVTRIFIVNNGMNGTIPENISELEELKALILSFNNISGELPSSISMLENMDHLSFFSNELEGDIPDMSNLNTMDELNLGDNNFSGPIPAHLGNLQSLNILDLSRNNFSGSIPSELHQLSFLNSLSLHDNDLSGTIPNEFTALHGLYYLYLHNNSLEGDITGLFENFDMLFSINLSNNQLTGNIDGLMSSSQIMNIDVKNNQLSGSIPSGFGALDDLQKLNLGNNNFHGCIPQDLKSLCSAEVELSGNFLLPWTGLFYDFCQTTGSQNAQIGAPCNDGIEANGTDDVINEDCSCGDAILSAKDLDDPKIMIYPNPSQGIFNIDMDDNAQYVIYDMTGSKLSSGTIQSNNAQLDISSRSGMYILEVIQENYKSHFKLVVN